MKICTPDYYKEFKCIAGACTDTCCAGWQVDVDDRSFAYYKTVTGEFGDRLASVMVEPKKNEEGQFRIRPDGRCPFLNDDNLCDLYTALGEDALCKTCEQYPRYTSEYGNLREIGIAFSCKTAAKIILKYRESHGYDSKEDPETFPSLNNIDGKLFYELLDKRNEAFAIIADRSLDIRKRMAKLLTFAEPAAPKKADALKTFNKIWQTYMKLVIIKPIWPVMAEQVQKTLYNECFERTREDFFEYYKDRAYEFENILNYFVYRYYLRGVYDKNVSKWVKLAVVGTLLIMHCDMAQWKLNNGSLSFEEQVEITHIYSREIEHSEENLAALVKALDKKSFFDVSTLLTII